MRITTFLIFAHMFGSNFLSAFQIGTTSKRTTVLRHVHRGDEDFFPDVLFSEWDDDGGDSQEKRDDGTAPAFDPSNVAFAAPATFESFIDFCSVSDELEKNDECSVPQEEEHSPSRHYPVSVMLHGSAPYIMNHHGKIAVVHIPGHLVDDPARLDEILSDISLAWLLGLKLVLVVGEGGVSLQGSATDDPEAQEEERRRLLYRAGYWRTEVERKLQKSLRSHHHHRPEDVDDGYVISAGSFYTIQANGAMSVHSQALHRTLENDNDVVLLSTVGWGDSEAQVIDGYHLAASVASALHAHKLIYVAEESSILAKEDEPIQEISVNCCRALLDHHKVQVHGTGWTQASPFEVHETELTPSAVMELLLHLAWATWALERDVTRAHIINPSNGAILEELFTSKNGLNTCLYHENDQGFLHQDAFAQNWHDFLTSRQNA